MPDRVKEKLVELLYGVQHYGTICTMSQMDDRYASITQVSNTEVAERLIAHGVTVQECAYWQYIEDDVDEDNNIQAYCSVCHAGDKHATSMIGKVPYCWKCGRKMMPQPPKGE